MPCPGVPATALLHAPLHQAASSRAKKSRGAVARFCAAGMSARMLIEANLTQVGADLPVPQVNESESDSAALALAAICGPCADLQCVCCFGKSVQGSSFLMHGAAAHCPAANPARVPCCLLPPAVSRPAAPSPRHLQPTFRPSRTSQRRCRACRRRMCSSGEGAAALTPSYPGQQRSPETVESSG